MPGVPEELARDIGLLPLMGVAPEIAQLAREHRPWHGCRGGALFRGRRA